ncbi:MAG: hypothetical protein LBR08_06360, partial [Bacteroidales bacterium]|nr:hypothetical protein [Bacteroidales bacterium]
MPNNILYISINVKLICGRFLTGFKKPVRLVPARQMRRFSGGFCAAWRCFQVFNNAKMAFQKGILA